MHENIRALKQALDEMGQSYSTISGFPDSLITQRSIFIRATTPFNRESVSLLCRDKAALYTILLGKIPQPKTDIFFASTATSLDFLYPCIVKMNAGERGTNVFLVSNKTEAQTALSLIFDKTTKHGDYIALVQEYIKPHYEIRAVIAAGRVVFAYEREIGALVSVDVLKIVTDISNTIIDISGLSWGALDFIKAESGQIYFLEANTRPSFESFIAVQGNRMLVDAYTKALEQKRDQ